MLCGFFVARRDRSEAFEPVNEQLYVIADAVELAIKAPFDLAAWVAMDDGLHGAGAHALDNPVGVVAGVGDQCTTTRMRDQFLGHCGVVLLARGQRNVDGPSLRIDKGVELR